MNKNESAWRTLFEQHDILNVIRASGLFTITSEEINRVRESRLMTKFDHSANLPKIFSDNNLAILPLTRGSYVIGDFKAYVAQEYRQDLKPTEYEFPSEIQSLNPANIFSESAAIHCAYVSGMIDDIVGEATIPTISGRMGTSKFDFEIGSSGVESPYYKLSVDNSQCEIDGGFEGPNSLAIVEAKNAISEDFIIRQLYYPVRLWTDKVSKKIIPIFLSYSNDVFHFFVYKFDEIGKYNSLKLVEQKNCIFSPEKITLEDIQALLEKVQIKKEPGIPFPQANSFKRIVDLLGLMANGEVDGALITQNYDFDARQSLYYTSAGKYLGLIEGDGKGYSLSKSGLGIMKMKYRMKYLSLAKAILSHEVFNKVFHVYLENSFRPSMEEVVGIMKSCRLYKVESESTYRRRSQTIVSWVEWILGLQDMRIAD